MNANTELNSCLKSNLQGIWSFYNYKTFYNFVGHFLFRIIIFNISPKPGAVMNEFEYLNPIPSLRNANLLGLRLQLSICWLIVFLIILFKK